MISDPLMKFEHVVVERGGVNVLDIEALNVERGRIMALIGPNGAGKSTLLMTMAGLLKPGDGKIYYKGNPILKSSDRAGMRRHVSVIFQEPLLLNTSVYKNIALGLNFRHETKEKIRQDVHAAMEYFGISSLAERSAKTLSGGEAKRVSLARVFALKPEMILMDEAFNSLDPPTRETLIDDLKYILEETRITAVMVAHDREETLRLAQDVAVMANGRIIQFGSTTQVFNQPESEFVAGFVGTETILEGVIEKYSDGIMLVRTAGKVIMAAGNYPVGQSVYCCIRPENITVLKDAPDKTSARNIFEARVKKIIRQAYFYKIILDCGVQLVSYITLPSYEELGIKEESVVTASFKATSVHVMKREMQGIIQTSR